MYKVKYDDISNNPKPAVFFVYLIPVSYNFILETYNNSVLKYNSQCILYLKNRYETEV